VRLRLRDAAGKIGDSYFPTFFVEVHGYTEPEAAALVGLSYGIGAIGYVTAAIVGEFVLTRRDTIAVWVSLGAAAFLALGLSSILAAPSRAAAPGFRCHPM